MEPVRISLMAASSESIRPDMVFTEEARDDKEEEETSRSEVQALYQSHVLAGGWKTIDSLLLSLETT